MHRHSITNSIINSIDESSSDLMGDFYLSNIIGLANLMNISVKSIIRYPQQVKMELYIKYTDYSNNGSAIEEIYSLLQDYNFNNKRKLVEIILVKNNTLNSMNQSSNRSIDFNIETLFRFRFLY